MSPSLSYALVAVSLKKSSSRSVSRSSAKTDGNSTKRLSAWMVPLIFLLGYPIEVLPLMLHRSPPDLVAKHCLDILIKGKLGTRDRPLWSSPFGSLVMQFL